MNRSMANLEVMKLFDVTVPDLASGPVTLPDQ